MEAITRLVADSLARHGFDLPVDPRRLKWSRWSRCDSPRSLLVVPSKPGIFALAEEVLDLDAVHGGTDALVRPVEPSSAVVSSAVTVVGSTVQEGHDFSRAAMPPKNSLALAAEGMAGGSNRAECARRMLAVLQFSEDDDMAFTLDRMFTRINPMRDRLASGKCFLRFVVIEDQAQRRSICAALNQWMLGSAEKATGIPAGFSTSLEFTTDRVARALSPVIVDSGPEPAQPPPLDPTAIAAALNSGAAKNLHCPHPLPSGF